MYRKVSRRLLRRIRGIGWNFSCFKPSYAVHSLEYAIWLFNPNHNRTPKVSYAAFDHSTLNFHQALENYIFMAFILHFAAVEWKALSFLGIKKISLISKLIIKNSEIMPTDDKKTSFNSSKNMKITITAPFLPGGKDKLTKHADQSSHRGAIHESASRVANLSLLQDNHFQIKSVTFLLSRLHPLRSSSLRSNWLLH